ncbi:hypothetical protein BDN70DRAFT_884388, partial [Pholiota conissans]
MYILESLRNESGEYHAQAEPAKNRVIERLARAWQAIQNESEWCEAYIRIADQ